MISNKFNCHFASLCGVCGLNDIVMTKMQQGIYYKIFILAFCFFSTTLAGTNMST